MCLECGFYKGRMVVDMKAKKQAREARLEAKRDAIKAQSGSEETADEAPDTSEIEEKTVAAETK